MATTHFGLQLVLLRLNNGNRRQTVSGAKLAKADRRAEEPLNNEETDGHQAALEEEDASVHVPKHIAVDTSQNEQVVRLERNSLGLFDIASATMANIAPAMSFYFSFGVIAATSGLASPLTIVAAAIAIAILGNTLTEFSRSTPSAGSFVTFIGKTFGPIAAIATAVVISAGYILAIAAVVVISGGWFDAILIKYAHFSAPWELYSSIFTAGAVYMMYRGAKISTKVAATFFALEMVILVVVSVFVIAKHPGSITFEIFNPAKLTRGFAGLSLGFPLAIFLFVGWENSAAMAEETTDPRHNVPKAVFGSIAIMAATFVFLAFATVVGFGNNIDSVSNSSVPFLDAAHAVASPLLFLAYIAGMTSIIGSLISGANSQARIIFSSGREGLLPQWACKVSDQHKTPWASFVIFLGLALAIAFIFGGRTDPIVFFGEVATLGTILIALVYLVANLALPFYYRKFHPDRFELIRHGILPVLGAIAIGYPLYELIKPGQPAPFDYFPYIALGVVALAIIYAVVLNSRHPGLASRVGSIVADAN